MKIETRYNPKPIPMRTADWEAWDDDLYDGGSHGLGFGRTRAEAIADLMADMAEQYEEELIADRVRDLRACGVSVEDVAEWFDVTHGSVVRITEGVQYE